MHTHGSSLKLLLLVHKKEDKIFKKLLIPYKSSFFKQFLTTPYVNNYFSSKCKHVSSIRQLTNILLN